LIFSGIWWFVTATSFFTSFSIIQELEAAAETLGLVLHGVTVEVMKENEKE